MVNIMHTFEFPEKNSRNLLVIVYSVIKQILYLASAVCPNELKFSNITDRVKNLTGSKDERHFGTYKGAKHGD